MTNSQDYRNQLEQMGQMPDFKNLIAGAYQDPVIKPITQEAANLYSNYLPTIFNAFVNAGTGAADMSPAARLASVGSALGRYGGQIAANKDVQNFYRTQIGDLANAEVLKWQQRQQQLKDLWQMAFQQEEAQRQEQARQAQLAAQRAAMAAPRFPDMPQQPKTQQQQIIDLINEARGLSTVIRNPNGTIIGRSSPDLRQNPAGYQRFEQIKLDLKNLGINPDRYDLLGAYNYGSY